MTAGPYLPGRTPRPPEGAFDHLKEVSHPLERCPAWRAGVQFFREGYYWEAHEVWEAVWMAAPENGPEKIMVQAAIQLANARLKQALDRPRAAMRLQRMASGLMQEAWNRGGGSVMGMVRPLSGSGEQYSAEKALLCGIN